MGIEGKEVKLTNLDKVYFPKDGYTKSHVMKHYQALADVILPYLKDRPESLNRFPDGIEGESFYHKDIEHHPDWAEIFERDSDEGHKKIHYLVCNDKATLAYMTNLGCIDLNPWSSRTQKPEYPDFMIIDLDPEDIGFDKVVEAALLVHDVLDSIGVEGYPKTSGKTGIHIYIPLGAKYTYEQCRHFGQLVATLAHQQEPEFTSIERKPANRQKKVYLDYLQNSLGQTLAAPYSIRPVQGAWMSTPLEWKEVNSKLHPSQFTIENAEKRLDKVGDIYKPIIGKGIDLGAALKQLETKI